MRGGQSVDMYMMSTNVEGNMALYPVFASVCLPPEALLAAGVRRALSPALELSCEAWASSLTEFSLLILLLILLLLSLRSRMDSGRRSCSVAWRPM